jgi:hypothetical protein
MSEAGNAWTPGGPSGGPAATDGSGAARQLWCAVIGRAVLDATDRVAAVSDSHSRRRIRDEARRWFSSNDSDFRYACESAGYDPDYLRLRVLRMLEEAI